MIQGGYREGSVFLNKTDSKYAGFTIIEVLLVLAISSMLVAAALIYIGGRQSKTEFMTASNDLQQGLQQVINETSSGYYPDSGKDCVVAGAGSLNFTSASTQGTNQACIFLGKVLYLGPANPTDRLQVLSVAGRRLDATGAEISSIASAYPTAMDVVTDIQLHNGLTYAWGGSSANTQGFALGIFQDLATSSDPGQSGTQSMGLYDFSNTSSWGSNVKAGINSNPAGIKKVTAGDRRFCMASTETDQSVLYVVDASLHVTMQVKNGKTC